MPTLVSALNTEFTPAVGDFLAQASGGSALLERRQTVGAAFVSLGPIHNAGVIVSNPVAGAIYRFTAAIGTPTVQADQ